MLFLQWKTTLNETFSQDKKEKKEKKSKKKEEEDADDDKPICVETEFNRGELYEYKELLERMHEIIEVKKGGGLSGQTKMI